MKIVFYIIISLNVFFVQSLMGQTSITFQSLLREMVDREKITEFPTIAPYKTLQASSYNRASISPDQPGWFADSDGVFCIRTEKNKKGETHESKKTSRRRTFRGNRTLRGSVYGACRRSDGSGT